ncbi:hypothetical protein EYZ11_001393 [Aspergillus tanneri]|uniref:Apurinic-apyrimidinic endonuclease 1 n=1 Tax=Aspergillus tanneri TaxID=1220188 RepID=A0A4S3JUR1_9EURO|nr:hypothetical protein EYZ11_001393 [Aspergillus tanneri]
MPPRGTRRATSGGAPRSQPTTSPGSNKRKSEESAVPSSPPRKSKKVKSTDQLKTVASSVLTESHGTVKQEVGEEEKEETKVSVHVQLEQGPDEKTAVKGKATKKQKTKLEKKSEHMPLRSRTQGLRMHVGAHVSAAKVDYILSGNAFALFLKSQRKWDNPPLQDDHRDQFRRLCQEQNYDAAKYILPHGSYLVNLAQEDKAKSKQAYDSFLDDLRRCEALGIKLYNFHPGSANQSSHSDALRRLAKALTNALSATTTVIPVLETMCGHGSTIGGQLTEFRDLLAMIPHEHHPRIGICIDTCHSFAAGYDLATSTGFQDFMKEFEDVIGLQHLRALHLNDSKAPRGSRRDLHANIGTGFLGLRAFHNVMNESRFEGLPMILETPIDRPESSIKNQKEEEDDTSDADSKKKATKKQPKRPAGAKPAMVADLSVWAKEIELLESLIGMDPEGPEFRALEKKLSDEGREEREKHQEQYDRKLESEKKKQTKGPSKKAQKSLLEMMNAPGRKGKASQTATGDGSEDEGCQSHSE